MAIPPTDWKPRVQHLIDRNLAVMIGSDPLIIGVVAGSDDRYGVDLADVLDVDEALAGVTTRLWRWYALGETADSEVTPIDDPDVTGTTVIQHVTGLERGRFYGLEILFGTAPNRRGRVLFLDVAE